MTLKRVRSSPLSIEEESRCRASEAVEPVCFWIYSPTLIPETVTPSTLPLCSWKLSMHDRVLVLGFISIQARSKSHKNTYTCMICTLACKLKDTHTIQSLLVICAFISSCTHADSGSQPASILCLTGKVLTFHRALKTPTHKNKVYYFLKESRITCQTAKLHPSEQHRFTTVLQVQVKELHSICVFSLTTSNPYL